MKSLPRIAWIVLPVLAGFSPAFAVPIGTDTFQDGTTQGWVVAIGPGGGGHPAPPANITTGGPAGAGDAFLQLTSFGGSGAGSRLSVINISQWAGDFTGVLGIRMDLINQGTTDLEMRLLIADPIPGPPANSAFSTTAVHLAAGGGWTTAYFSLEASDLTAAIGSVGAALSGATELRLYHSPVADGTAQPIVALLGVDNIRAVRSVPDRTHALTLFTLGFGALAAFRARRSRN